MSDRKDDERRRRELEDMEKDELIGFIKKMKERILLVAGEKKVAEDLYNQCCKEKDDMKAKAMQIMKRCKDLEEIKEKYDRMVQVSEREAMAANGSDSNEKLMILESEVQKWRSLFESKSTDFDKKSTECENLQGQVSDLSLSLEKVQEQARSKATLAIEKIKEFKGQLDAKTQEALELKAKTIELENTLLEVRQTVQSNESVNEDNSTVLQSLQNERETLSIMLSDKQQKVELLEDKVRELERALASAKMNSAGSAQQADDEATSAVHKLNEELEKNLTGARAEVTKYKVAMDKAVQKFREMKLIVDTKTTEAAASQAECEALKNRIAELEQTLRTSSVGSADVPSTAENHASIHVDLHGHERDRIQQLEVAIEEKTTQLTTLLTEKSSLQTTVDQLTLSHEESVTRAVELQSKISELEKGLEESKHQHSLFASRVCDLEAELSRVVQQESSSVDELREERDLAVSRVTELEAAVVECTAMSASLDQTRKELDEALSKITEMQHADLSAVEERLTLLARLSEKEGALAAVHEQLQFSERDRAAAVAKADELASMLEVKVSQLAILKQQSMTVENNQELASAKTTTTKDIMDISSAKSSQDVEGPLTNERSEPSTVLTKGYCDEAAPQSMEVMNSRSETLRQECYSAQSRLAEIEMVMEYDSNDLDAMASELLQREREEVKLKIDSMSEELKQLEGQLLLAGNSITEGQTVSSDPEIVSTPSATTMATSRQSYHYDGNTDHLMARIDLLQQERNDALFKVADLESALEHAVMQCEAAERAHSPLQRANSFSAMNAELEKQVALRYRHQLEADLAVKDTMILDLQAEKGQLDQLVQSLKDQLVIIITQRDSHNEQLHMEAADLSSRIYHLVADLNVARQASEASSIPQTSDESEISPTEPMNILSFRERTMELEANLKEVSKVHQLAMDGLQQRLEQTEFNCEELLGHLVEAQLESSHCTGAAVVSDEETSLTAVVELQNKETSLQEVIECNQFAQNAAQQQVGLMHEQLGFLSEEAESRKIVIHELRRYLAAVRREASVDAAQLAELRTERNEIHLLISWLEDQLCMQREDVLAKEVGEQEHRGKTDALIAELTKALDDAKADIESREMSLVSLRLDINRKDSELDVLNGKMEALCLATDELNGKIESLCLATEEKDKELLTLQTKLADAAVSYSALSDHFEAVNKEKDAMIQFLFDVKEELMGMNEQEEDGEGEEPSVTSELQIQLKTQLKVLRIEAEANELELEKVKSRLEDLHDTLSSKSEAYEEALNAMRLRLEQAQIHCEDLVVQLAKAEDATNRANELVEVSKQANAELSLQCDFLFRNAESDKLTQERSQLLFAELEGKLVATLNARDGLSDEIVELKAVHSAHKDREAALVGSTELIAQEINQWKAELAVAVEERRMLTEQLALSQAEIEIQKGLLVSTKLEFATATEVFNSKFKELESATDMKSEALIAAQSRIEELEGHLSEVRQSLMCQEEQLSEKVKSLELARSTAMAQVSELTGTLQLAEEKAASLETELRVQQTTLSEVTTTELDAAQATITRLQEEVQSKILAIQQDQLLLEQNAHDLELARAQSDAFQAELKAAKTRIVDLEGALTIALEDQATTDRAREDAVTRASELQSMLTAVQESNEAAALRIEELEHAFEASNADHTKAISTLQVRLQEAESCSNSLQSALEAELAEINATLEHSHNERDNLASKVAELEHSITSGNADAMATIETLRAAHAQVQTERDEIMSESQTAKKEFASLQCSLQNELACIQSKVAELESSLESARTDLAAALADIASAQVQYEESQSTAQEDQKRQLIQFSSDLANMKNERDEALVKLSELESLIEKKTAEFNSTVVAAECALNQSTMRAAELESAQFNTNTQNADELRQQLASALSRLADFEAAKPPANLQVTADGNDVESTSNNFTPKTVGDSTSLAEENRDLKLQLATVQDQARARAVKAVEKIKEFKSLLDGKVEELRIAQERIVELEASLYQLQLSTVAATSTQDSLIESEKECPLPSVADSSDAVDEPVISTPIDELTETIHRLQEEVKIANRTIAELKASLADARTGASQSSDIQAPDGDDDVEKPTEERMNATNEQSASHEDHSFKKSDMADTEDSTDLMKKNLTELVAEKEQLSLSLQNALIERDGLYERIQELEKACSDANAVNAAELEAARCAYEELQHSIGTKTAEAAELLEAKQALEEKVSELTERIDKIREHAKEHVAKAVDKVKLFKGQLEEKTGELKAAETRIAELEQSLLATRDAILAETQAAAELAKAAELSATEALRNERDDALRRLSDLEASLEEQLNEVKSAEEIRVQSMAKELSTLTDACQQKQQQVDEAEQEITSLKAQLEQVTTEIESCKHASSAKESSLEEECNSLRNELKSIAEENAELQRSKDHMKGTMGKAKERLQELKVHLDEKTTQCEKALADCTNLREEISHLTDALNNTSRKARDSEREFSAQLAAVLADFDAARTAATAREVELNEALRQAESNLKRIQEGLAEFSERYVQVKTSEETVKSLNTSIDLQLKEALQSLEDRDTQLASYAEHVAALEQKSLQAASSSSAQEEELLKFRKRNKMLIERDKVFRAALEAKDEVKTDFEVLLRCSDGAQIWCLISREKLPVELDGEDLLREDRARVMARMQQQHGSDNVDGMSAPSSLPQTSKRTTLKKRISEERVSASQLQSKNSDHHDLPSGTSTKTNESSVTEPVSARRDEEDDTPSGISKETSSPQAHDDQHDEEDDLHETSSSHTVIEWIRESEVLQWVAARSKKCDNQDTEGTNFSIESSDAGDIELPPTVQEELAAAFDIERNALSGQISALKQEKEASQIAFDLYRDRARDSLRRSAVEQQASEAKIVALQENLNAQLEKITSAEVSHRSLKEQYNQLLAEFNGVVIAEKRNIANLRNEAAAIRQEMQDFADAEQRRSVERSAQAIEVAQSTKERLEQMEVLEDECEQLRQREKQLRTEMKKKSDLARQMLLEKDAIIGQLREGRDVRITVGGTQSGRSSGVGAGGAGAVDATKGVSFSAVEASTMPENKVTTEDSLSVSSCEKTPTKQPSTATTTVRESTLSPPGDFSRADLEDNVSAESPGSASSPALRSPRMGIAADREHEQRLAYLRQAFCGFVRAKQGVEMENLGRVICAILGLTPEEQASVMENIAKLAPAVVATSTFEVFSSNLSSIFA